MNDAKLSFWEWFDATVETAKATPEGAAFAAAGFELAHTGGGCTAWQRAIAGTDWVVSITDSEGLGHKVDPDENWLVGACQTEGEGDTPCYDAATPAEALNLADELVATLTG